MKYEDHILLLIIFNNRKVLTAFGLVLLLSSSFYSQRSPSLDAQAQVRAINFYKKRFSKCGEYYYHQINNRGLFLYQCKYAPTISANGTTHQPKPLSEADRLNEVDPLPVAWGGTASVKWGLCRYQQYDPEVGPGYNAWSEWIDRNDQFVHLWNKKGIWEFLNISERKEFILPISCNVIPSETKLPEVREPSWGNTNNYGSRKLTIPANYGKWLYLGTGPIKISLPSLYSRIYTDGSNNSRSPNGGATYVGAQKTSPDAIAPKLKLGAVIAKLGENGEPFQLFTDTSSQLNGYSIKSNDKVYIAINDSYYADNRGEHIVYINGKNLCINCPYPERDVNSGQGQNPTAGGRYASRVQHPSTRTRVYNIASAIQLSIPDNWQAFESGQSAQFAPEGAYGDSGITHGVMIGITQTNGRDLGQATEQYINGFLQSNNYLRQSTNYSRATLGGRQAYATVLSGRLPLTNRNEIVNVYTTQLRNGSLLYVAMVAPEEESASYNNTFRNVIRSIRLND